MDNINPNYKKYNQDLNEFLENLTLLFTKLFGRLFKTFLLNTFIVVSITFITSTLAYKISPMVFLMYLQAFQKLLGISIFDSFVEAEELIQKQSELVELKKKLEAMYNEKSSLEIQLSDAEGKKKGILADIEAISYEKINWWNVILTTAGITIVGICVMYFFFGGGENSDQFQVVSKQVGKTSETFISHIGKTTESLNLNIANLSERIEKIDNDMNLVKNSITLLQDFVVKNRHHFFFKYIK